MLDSARAVVSYTEQLEAEAFHAQRMVQAAVIRELEIIGEAARTISDATKLHYPNIPWAQILGMRNRIAHEYLRVDLEIVWQTVQKDIPALIPLLIAAVSPDDDNDGESPPTPTTQERDPAD